MRGAYLISEGRERYNEFSIPLLALVVYVYAVEIERQNWSLVFAGLGSVFCVAVEIWLNGVVFDNQDVGACFFGQVWFLSDI